MDEFQFSIAQMVLPRKGMREGYVRLMEMELQRKKDAKLGLADLFFNTMSS